MAKGKPEEICQVSVMGFTPFCNAPAMVVVTSVRRKRRR
jgi:hypothetical protein